MSTTLTHQVDAAEERPSLFKRFGAVMTAIFTPILPPLIAAGLIQGVVSILATTGALSEESAEYYVLNTFGSAIFFFLPFLLALSSARAFDTNPFLAMGLAAILLHPNTAALMEAEEPVDFLGITIPQTTYSSSVVPIIVIVWLLAVIDRALRRRLPQLLHTLLVPPLATLVTGLLALMLVGPLANGVALGVSSVVEWAQDTAPWLVPTLIGTFGALLITVGASFTLFPIAIAQTAELGYNTVYGPGMLAVNFALVGVAIAVTRQTRNRRYRTYSSSAGVTTAMGVSQPTLYGIAVPLGKPLVATCIGGFAGGLLAGISGFKIYAFLPSGAAAVPAFVGGGGAGNLIRGLAVMAVALGVGLLATRLLGFDEPSDEVVAQVTGGDDAAQADDATKQDR